MARNYQELRNQMSPEAQERAERLANEDLLELNLRELRQQIGALSQTGLAEMLGVSSRSL